jgi:hypothetical protein
MGKKVTVTLTRVFKKEVEVVISDELIKGMTDEEIATFLMEEYDTEGEDKVFENAEYEQIPHEEDSLDGVDTDRFDIFEGEKKTYGGHL